MKNLLLLLFLFGLNTIIAQQIPPIYISLDQGNEWQPFYSGLAEGANLRAIVEDEERLFLSTSQHGVFLFNSEKSEWEAKANVGLPLGNEFFFPTSLYASQDTLIIGTHAHGTFYSFDQGNNWQVAKTDIPSFARCFLESPWGLLAGTESGIWQSNDGGQNWQKFNGYSDEEYIINGLEMHQGKLIVASQNGLGQFDGKQINWSSTTSKTAILQMISDGKYIHAFNYLGEMFFSANGQDWELKVASENNQQCNSLTDALRQGYWPEVPSPHWADIVISTTKGWVSIGGVGCRLPRGSSNK